MHSRSSQHFTTAQFARHSNNKNVQEASRFRFDIKIDRRAYGAKVAKIHYAKTKQNVFDLVTLRFLSLDGK